MFMDYVKSGALWLLLIFIIVGAYYAKVIDSIKTLILLINEKFLSLMPVEGIAIIMIIFFAIIMSLAYAFFRE
jgi:hypothetical protein